MDNNSLDIDIKMKVEQMKKEISDATIGLKKMGDTIVNIKKITKDGALDKIVISAKNNAQQITSTINKAGQEIRNVKKTSDITGKALKSNFDVGKFYLFWNVTKRIRTSITGWFKSAVDFNETVNKFNVSMGKSVNEATRFQNKLSEAFGTAKQEMMDYQSTFKNILGGMGNISTETSEKISESLVKMGLDYSSLFNVSQKDAMNKFQSALVGSIMPIRRDSGYDVSRNAVIGKAQQLGIERNYQQLNETEKRLIRIMLLMDQLKNTGAFNDLARTIESPSNQIKVLKNQLQELQMWLGNVFMGTIGKILPYINGFVMALKELIKMFAIFVGYKSETTGMEDVLKVDDNATSNIASNLGKASKQAKELKKTLMGFDVLNVITTPKEPKSKGSGVGSPSVDPKILNALKEYDSIMENVRMKATKIRDKIMEWLGFTKQINPFTGEISWKLKEGFSNLKLIVGLISTLFGLFIISKIIKLIGSISKLNNVLKGSAKPISNFQFGLLGISKSLKVGKHSTLIKGLLLPLGKLIGAIGGVSFAIKGITSMFGIYDKVLKKETVTNKELRSSVLEITGGFTALGTAIGGAPRSNNWSWSWFNIFFCY